MDSVNDHGEVRMLIDGDGYLGNLIIVPYSSGRFLVCFVVTNLQKGNLRRVFNDQSLSVYIYIHIPLVRGLPL